MMENNDTLAINLRFGTWTLPMTIRREEEYAYRQAEKLIKERYNFYTSNYHGQSTEMYLIMTLLDVAVQFKQHEVSTDETPIISRIGTLLTELESALADK